jgi:hypothetical protein
MLQAQAEDDDQMQEEEGEEEGGPMLINKLEQVPSPH